jgi:outer membrane protein TolC
MRRLSEKADSPRWEAISPSRRRLTTAATTLLVVLISVPAASAQSASGPRLDGRALTIEESIALSLEQNRSIRDARLQLLTAERQVKEARGRAMPDISVNASFTRNLQPLESLLPAIIFDPTADPDDFIAVRFGADNNWSSALSVSQPLFDYSVFVGLKVASQFRQLQVEGVRGAAQQAATSTRRAFHEVLLARERFRLTESSVQRLRQTLEETRARNQEGLASDYDVLRLEVELGNLEPQLRQASDILAAAGRGLAIAMGLDIESTFTPLGSLREIDVTTRTADTAESRSLVEVVGEPRALAMSYDDLLARALAERSDLRQARINRNLSQAQVKATMSDLFPSLSGFYNYSLTAQENGRPDFFGENSRQQATVMQAGIQVEIPLFSGFQNSARLQQQKIAVDRSNSSLALLRDQATNQLRTLLDALDETRLRAQAQARAVDQANLGFEIASAQYREGVSSRLEVVDAENALRQAEFNFAQAVYDHLNAQADFDLAVGRVPLVDDTSITNAGIR